jgi:uncharacterized Zn-finger protein
MLNISNYTLSDIEDDNDEMESRQPTQSEDILTEHYSSFKVRNAQRNNIRTHYKCEIDGCGKVFTQICNVKRHLLVHLNIKEFQCKVCSKQFT